MEKKNKIIIYIIIIVIVLFNLKSIRYIVFDHSDRKDLISAPDRFIFKDINNQDYNEVFYESDKNYYDDVNKITYILVDEKWINSDDVFLHMIGSYYNAIDKPIVKINGKTIPKEKISIQNRKSDGLFSELYIIKDYNIYIYDTIEENKVYKIYVRLNNNSESIKIKFVTRLPKYLV